MTTKEKRIIAASLAVYFKDIGDNVIPEQTANAGIDLVRMLIGEFPEVSDDVDYALSEDPNAWDALIHFLKIKKGDI